MRKHIHLPLLLPEAPVQKLQKTGKTVWLKNKDIPKSSSVIQAFLGVHNVYLTKQHTAAETVDHLAEVCLFYNRDTAPPTGQNQ